MTEHFYRPADGHRLRHDPLNSIIAPRPIGWIGTRSETGVRNLAPYSFFNVFNYTPPIIGFCSLGAKDSVGNARQTGVFTWNLATRGQAEQVNATSATVPAEVDEYALAGLEPVPATDIAADRVGGAPVSFECRVASIVQLQRADGVAIDSWLVLGEVVAVHIDDRLLVDGLYRTALADPILRGGGPTAFYTISEAHRFDLIRPA